MHVCRNITVPSLSYNVVILHLLRIFKPRVLHFLVLGALSYNVTFVQAYPELDDGIDAQEMEAARIGMSDEELEDDSRGGYGGIVMSSVEDIISKARVSEAFIKGVSGVGLSGDLEDLAKLVNEDEEKQEGKWPLDIQIDLSQCAVELL